MNINNSLLVSAALSAFSLSGAAQAMDARVALNFGLLNGTMGEYALDPSKPVGGGNRLSQLDWDLENVPMIGLEAEVAVNSFLSVRGEAWTKAGSAIGQMVDRDWQDPWATMPTGGLIPYADDAWTDRSFHPNSPVDEAWNWDLSLAVSPEGSLQLAGLAIKPRVIAGVRRDHYAQSAIGGSGVYSVFGFRDQTASFDPTAVGIDYRQDLSAVFVGAGGTTQWQGITLSLEGALGRFDGEAVDNHYARGIQFQDSVEGGDFQMVKADATLPLSGLLAPVSGLMLKAGLDYVHYRYQPGPSRNNFNECERYRTYIPDCGSDFGPFVDNATAMSYRGTTVSLGLVAQF